MKNLNLILNVVVLVAVIILYILHFTDKEKPQTITSEPASVDTLASAPRDIKPARVAFVNTDTILAEYKYFQDLQKKLQLRQNNAEYQLSQKMKALEEDYKNLLSKIKLGLISQSEAERQFAEKQQKVEEYRNNIREELIREEQLMTESLYDTIVAYIKRYNSSDYAQYNYILGFSRGGGILHADEQFDLTQEVLDGLNREYEKKKNKK